MMLPASERSYYREQSALLKNGYSVPDMNSYGVLVVHPSGGIMHHMADCKKKK
jgi:hypothetical protein